ncbi:MAG: NYN domain-containing protein [Clostridiales bacterium]|jgi:uncharacterized LabA/DUF88 family protein|nr:NYN domain-containing protein [Clostridiales bacterium]
MKTAILIDGGFYRIVANQLWKNKVPNIRADELITYCQLHIKQSKSELYRIYYYDCPPISKKVFMPIANKTIDLSKKPLYTWATDFFTELKTKRKVSLRLGVLADSMAHYNIKPDVTKKICNGTIKVKDLTEDDFELKVEQKGVDIKIGLDIATLAYKKQVDQIILISGDSDFVPVAKFARREGIDFILDAMGRTIREDLQEHIDGLRNQIKHMYKRRLLNTKKKAK